MFFYSCKKTKPAQTVTAGTGGNIARHIGKTIFRKKIHTITSKHILPVCARKPITKSTKQPCVQNTYAVLPPSRKVILPAVFYE